MAGNNEWVKVTHAFLRKFIFCKKWFKWVNFVL